MLEGWAVCCSSISSIGCKTDLDVATVFKFEMIPKHSMQLYQLCLEEVT